jgi:hypothetical protein
VERPIVLTRAEIENIKDLASARNAASAANSGPISSTPLSYAGMSPEAMKLHEALEKIGTTGRRELAALFWIGRGDHPAAEFSKLFLEAYDEGQLIHYLRAKIKVGEAALKVLNLVEARIR